MLTTTHALAGLAALSRRDAPTRNRWVLFGSLLPDIPIFVWGGWHIFVLGTDGATLWRELYFAPFMQTLIAPFNSVVVLGALAALAWWQRQRGWAQALLMVALAGLLHIALDAPVHTEDAYRHLWPLSDYRFHSPVSYWDADRGAGWFMFVESAVVLLCVAVLWRRFSALWVRGLLGVIAGLTLALPLILSLVS